MPKKMGHHLIPYPTEYAEPAKVLLKYMGGQKPPLNEVANACYQLEGVALGVLLPYNEEPEPEPPAPPPDAEADDDSGNERQADQPKTPPAEPLVKQKRHPGLSGVRNPNNVNREECEHILKQCTGERDGGMRGTESNQASGWLPPDFAKKLMAVAMKILMELMTNPAS